MASIDELSASRLPPKRRRRLTTPGIPWYRDIKVLQILWQVVFVVVLVGGLLFLFGNLANNLAASNLSLDFNVYKRRFGAEISEGIRFDQTWNWITNFNITNYTLLWSVLVGMWVVGTLNVYLRQRQHSERNATLIAGASIALLVAMPRLSAGFIDWAAPYLEASTMTRAIITGIYNTLRVVFLAIIGSTILGVLVGIGLLSKNFLVRRVSQVFVEIFRNTPLLVQLIFIHRGLQTILPQVQDSYTSPNKFLFFDFYEKFFVVNVRGFSVPGLKETNSATWFYIFVGLGLVAAYFVRRWRLTLQEESGDAAQVFRFIAPVLLLFVGAGWLLAGGYPLDGGPFTVEYPQAGRFNIQGGWFMSLAFFALFLGLTLYTAAFIADIVRSGIQSVPHGQVEAARAHGLTGSQTLSLVVLPQALRLIIPPLGNQYVNLGKNSSLGIAVTFMDIYFVVQLANNESGQSVPFFLAMMLIYLALSLSLSMLTNLFNQTTTIRSR